MSRTNKKQPNSIDVYVGSRIKQRRTMNGMSQERLGDSLGITFQQVQKYERGINRVGAGRLQTIADILDVPVSFFFESASGHDATVDLPHASPQDDCRTFLSSREGLRLNREFVKITDPQLRLRIIEMVEAMAADSDIGKQD
ncbi:helix-turn-helix domain-containing protein [Rhizobium pusense]|uniref:helix-turn-helix domain-containing protein n=1 Tax=Agrobacterium pusense TaxID=648995 RepID=UPI000D19B59D|nr:helix-turn-helix transcriptional regulator [Agrobacterium pusense]MDH0910484.1 helix-turn-helix domain-containing protein [Agrobacterium pusense]MDH1098349.1 helix-turn-helix domain-containing protein [Agrobacterium pusense]MDH1114511.1 helix-turn-helix domain-containing protein [Agrobacterium pusense]MDH2195725.1 helix-turn-helix domain-containing protein [Agrobacterium pusense]